MTVLSLRDGICNCLCSSIFNVQKPHDLGISPTIKTAYELRVRDLVQKRSTKCGAITVSADCPLFQPRTWNFSNLLAVICIAVLGLTHASVELRLIPCPVTGV